MESVRKELYNAITDKLKELNLYEWIDLDKAQVDRQKENYPFYFPAAFIRIRNIQYEDMTLDMQEAEATIDVLVFFDRYGDTFDGAVDRTESLNILDNLDVTIQKLQWEEVESFGIMTNTNDEDLTERYKRPAYKLTFKTIIYKCLNTDNYVFNN